MAIHPVSPSSQGPIARPQRTLPGVDPVAAAIEGSNQDLPPYHSTLHHLPELDGLRGLAALGVFFHHVCYASMQPTGWSPFVRTFYTLAIPGAYGVDLFFVLSGFLITSLLLEARSRPAFYHDFYWKRALRILPLYTLCLLVVFFTVPASGPYVLLSALFLANFGILFHVVTSGPFWTLAIEEQFYLVWPALLRRRSVVQLRRIALGLALASATLRLGASLFGHHNFYLTFYHCDGLALGACIAFWFYQRDRSQPPSTRERRVSATMLIAGLTLVAPSLWPSLHARFLPQLDALALTGVTLLCAFLIAHAVTHTGQPHLALLRSPALTFFGLISYAMYMTHLYVILAYDHLRGPLSPGDMSAYLVRFAAILAATLALCLLSRYLIELPANSLRRFVLHKPPLSNQSIV